MKDLIMKLCSLSGVSSWEDEVRAFLRAEAAPYVQEMRTDALGNLILFKKGAKPARNKLMLCAQMDEVGLMVRHITDEGYLKFDSVGEIDRFWVRRYWWVPTVCGASLD